MKQIDPTVTHVEISTKYHEIEHAMSDAQRAELILMGRVIQKIQDYGIESITLEWVNDRIYHREYEEKTLQKLIATCLPASVLRREDTYYSIRHDSDSDPRNK